MTLAERAIAARRAVLADEKASRKVQDDRAVREAVEVLRERFGISDSDICQAQAGGAAVVSDGIVWTVYGDSIRVQTLRGLRDVETLADLGALYLDGLLIAT